VISELGAQNLLAVIEEQAASPFLIDATDGRTLTYSEAHDLACRLAGTFVDRGFEPGSRVLVSLPNGLDLALVYLAALYADLTVIPLGPGFGVRELRAILARTRARRMLHAPGNSSRLADLAREAGVEVVSVTGAEGGGINPCEPTARPVVPFAHWRPENVVAIHFTSGTTGAPRGIGHRLGDFLANAGRVAAAIEAGPELRFHAMLPMTYLGGYYNLLVLPLTLGASVVVDRPFDGQMAINYWKVPARHDVTALWLVPTIMAMLLRLDRDERGHRYCREHIRAVAVGMGPLSTELREEFNRVYGTTVLESYGLAETLLATSATTACQPPPGSCGTALEGVRLRAVDQAGDELAPGVEGVIEIATPDMMVGYLNDAGEFDSGCGAGGWLNTGDLGVLAPDGQLQITGRVKDIIIRGGIRRAGGRRGHRSRRLAPPDLGGRHRPDRGMRVRSDARGHRAQAPRDRATAPGSRPAAWHLHSDRRTAAHADRKSPVPGAAPPGGRSSRSGSGAGLTSTRPVWSIRLPA
jgi:acyl-coenzyme A synthetase/AMP-(fatty) acid ligase